MSKAANVGRASARGSFHYLWGLVISTIISSVGTIFIARLLGSDSYGLYSIVLLAPTLITILRDWGMNQAMVRFIAQYRSENRDNELRSIFISGIIFEIVIGLILSVISFFLSNLLATNIFNRPEIGPLIQIASFTILAGGLINAATAVFTGMEKMHLNSIMLIAQSTIKTIIIVSLVLLGLGTTGATIGYTSAAASAGIFGILLVLMIYKSQPKPASHKLEIKAYTQTMLTFGIPLSIGAIFGGILPHFYTFLLPIHYVTDNTMIGNYGVAANFVVLITFFSLPITTMLFPAFSKLDAQKDQKTLQNVFQYSIKYASLFVVPVAALVMCLSEPAVTTLFGHTYDSAPLFLVLLSINYFFTAFGSLSYSSLISSQGQTSFILKLNLLNAAIGFPVGYILIMRFGVLGLIAISLTANIPSLLIGLRFIKQQYGLVMDWTSSVKILFSSITTAVLTYIIILQFALPSWMRLIIGVLIFIPILIAAIILTKTLNKTDINNLREMALGLGPLSSIITSVLRVIEKLIFT